MSTGVLAEAPGMSLRPPPAAREQEASRSNNRRAMLKLSGEFRQ
jgi:hypothetical protein